MLEIYKMGREEFLEKAKIPTRVKESEEALYEEMAQIMVDTIVKNNGKQTVIICPVGPIGHYPIFAEKVNKLRLSLKNCWFINMDEYLDDDNNSIAYEHPLGFKGTMDRMLYSRVDEELLMPEEQRIFPEPGKEKEIDALFESFEKVDLCLTSVGINGHIAFNEPSFDDITDEQFGQVGTRCLDIAPQTIAINGSGKFAGALDIFPKRCITLGMKQLLSAEVLKIYMFRDWHWGIMRKITLLPYSKEAPASYLQTHPNAEMVITEALANHSIF